MIATIGEPQPGTNIERCPQRRRLIITIDVEALPLRAPSDHVERLIWGKFHTQDMGIRRIMAIANRYGRALTFFLDLCEIPLYPGVFDEVARTIKEEGHDLQLHAHPDVLPADFWAVRDVPKPTVSLSLFDYKEAFELVKFLAESAMELGQPQPLAFRGGAFRYNEAILAAMAANKITLGFNYKYKSAHQSNSSENLPVFRWSNGITEFPMGLVEYRGGLRAFEFSSTSSLDFDDICNVHAYMERYFAEVGENAVLVMLMHSWSLLSLNQGTGYFEYGGDGLAQRFEHFLATLPSDVDVITAAQAALLLERGICKPGAFRNVGLASRSKHSCAGLDSSPIAATHKACG